MWEFERYEAMSGPLYQPETARYESVDAIVNGGFQYGSETYTVTDMTNGLRFIIWTTRRAGQPPRATIKFYDYPQGMRPTEEERDELRYLIMELAHASVTGDTQVFRERYEEQIAPNFAQWKTLCNKRRDYSMSLLRQVEDELEKLGWKVFVEDITTCCCAEDVTVSDLLAQDSMGDRMLYMVENRIGRDGRF